MQYMLMIHSEEGGWNKLTKTEQEQGMAAYNAYTEALKKASILKSSNRLQPSSANSSDCLRFTATPSSIQKR